jgi:threonine dehydrogenase-like Zn-dependent dehydrogenase
VTNTPLQALRWELTGAGIENLGPNGRPVVREVPRPGPGQVLARVDACGICFSDIKILNLGEKHPRLRGRDLAREPVVMGHEVALTVVEAGEGVDVPFGPGCRMIVQADVYYKGRGMAFGYMLDGGFSQYVLVGREVLHGDEGCYLLPIAGRDGYAEAALCEPWACVEASYRYEFRRGLLPGGTAWFLAPVTAGASVDDADPDVDRFTLTDGLETDRHPRRVIYSGPRGRFFEFLRDRCRAVDAAFTLFPPPSDLEEIEAARSLAGGGFDDVIWLGRPEGRFLEALSAALKPGGILNLCCRDPGALDLAVDVGRIHYENVQYVGTSRDEIASAYQGRASAELTPDGVAWFIGAGGPMGQMHLQRCFDLPKRPRKIVATQNTGPRLEDLRERFTRLAAERGVELVLLNPREMSPEALHDALRTESGGGFHDIVCMVPNVGVLESAQGLLCADGGLNIFAGIPVGTSMRLSVQSLCQRGTRLWGTSGSTIADLSSTLEKMERGVLATDRVVAAVGGIGAVRDGLLAVRDGRFLGKTVIYPQLDVLPLLSVSEVAARYPSVATQLTDGKYWNRDAEEELLRLAG